MIDREKAGALGVTFEDINNTISTNLGSTYINDFPNRGRMQRVIVQADRAGRMQTEDILNYNVNNSRGQLVPFSAFAKVDWSRGPTQIAGFNYYPAVRISGEAGPAIPPAMRSPRWSGSPASCRAASATSGPASRCRKSSPARRRRSCSACRSRGLPVPGRAVRKLDHPAGGDADGAARRLRRGVAALLRGLPNDVYFTVGLITIIGLAAKDAILIIEFAKDLRASARR